jgi:hypothetical protein
MKTDHQTRREILRKLEPKVAALKPLLPIAFHYQDELEIIIRRNNEISERAALKQWERPQA